MNIEYGEFSISTYTEINWSYAEFNEFSNDSWSNLDWGHIEYDEFSTSSYTEIDWGNAEFNEFEDDTWTYLDWGNVQYQEFNDSSYLSMDWGKVEYNELGNDDYLRLDWGKVEFNEFEKDDYKATSWNKVQMKEFGNDDYKKIDWGKVEYKEVLKSSSNLNNVDWGKVQTNEWDKADLKFLTKGSTAKKLDKLINAELDINVLKKGKSFKGDKDDDVITAAGKLLKKKVNVKGGAGDDTFVLKKGKGSMVIQDIKDKVDEINFAYCGAASKIKLKQEGKDTVIYSGNDELANIKNINKSVPKQSAFGLV